MPSLFPENISFEDGSPITDIENTLNFKGSYLFDFEKGEFVKNPDRTIVRCDDLQAYMQWCQMALLTDRYRYIYSNLYGQQFEELKTGQLSKEAIELEIKRMTKETLMVHPRTKDVSNFVFSWSDNKEEVYYTYEVTTVDYEKGTLDNTVKVG